MLLNTSFIENSRYQLPSHSKVAPFVTTASRDLGAKGVSSPQLRNATAPKMAVQR